MLKFLFLSYFYYYIRYASVIASDFLSLYLSPNHGLWKQRGFLLDGEDPPEKVDYRKESYLLEFMNVDVARDFAGVVFHVLLDGAKGSHSHPDCCCFEPPHSLNLDFKSLYLLSFSMVLIEVLVSRGIVMSMRREVLSFLFLSTMSGLLAAMVLSVCMGMSYRLFNIIIIITVIIIKVLIIHLLSYLI